MIEDPDEADLIRNRMMYTLTGEKEFLNRIYTIHGKKGPQIRQTMKRKRGKVSGFYKRPNRSKFRATRARGGPSSSTSGMNE